MPVCHNSVYHDVILINALHTAFYTFLYILCIPCMCLLETCAICRSVLCIYAPTLCILFITVYCMHTYRYAFLCMLLITQSHFYNKVFASRLIHITHVMNIVHILHTIHDTHILHFIFFTH